MVLVVAIVADVKVFVFVVAVVVVVVPIVVAGSVEHGASHAISTPVPTLDLQLATSFPSPTHSMLILGAGILANADWPICVKLGNRPAISTAEQRKKAKPPIVCSFGKDPLSFTEPPK